MKRIVKYASLLILPVLFLAVAMAQDQDEFEFSHQLHDEMGLGDCATCHAQATESTVGSDDLLPSAETCEVCHGDAVVPPTDLARITDYQPIFSHEMHNVDEGIDCETCHTGILQDTMTTVAHLPTMTDCYACHESDVKQIPADCYMCHGPQERLTPITHTLTWTDYHGTQLVTEQSRQECATCHVSESFCQDCHFGDNLTQQIHPMNWEYTHDIEARHRSFSCTSCHESEQFCADCHTANLVMPVNHAVPGWAVAGTGGMHASRAAMDIDNCVVCHTSPADNPICLECHTQ